MDRHQNHQMQEEWWIVYLHVDVSENSGTPQSSFPLQTIHFGVPLLLETPMCIQILYISVHLLFPLILDPFKRTSLHHSKSGLFFASLKFFQLGLGELQTFAISLDRKDLKVESDAFLNPNGWSCGTSHLSWDLVWRANKVSEETAGIHQNHPFFFFHPPKKESPQYMYTLQGINISHLGKRKIIFKIPFWGDMLVPWRVYTYIALPRSSNFMINMSRCLT